MIKKILWILTIMMVIGITACGSNETAGVNQDEGMDEVCRIIPLSVSFVDILCELDIEMVGVPDSQYTLPDEVKDIERVISPSSTSTGRFSFSKYREDIEGSSFISCKTSISTEYLPSLSQL